MSIQNSLFPSIDPLIPILSPPNIDQSPLETALAYYLDNPVEWAEDVVGVMLYDWQREVLKDLAAHRFVSVRSGHGVGKSAAVALSALWFLCTHPFSRVICTAPTREQLIDVLWAEFGQWIRRSKNLNDLVEWSKDRITMRSNPEEWFIAARTAEVKRMKDGFSVAEGLQGRHAESILFIIDEASGIDEAIMSTVYGALTTPDAHILMTGNPTRITGTFYESHHNQRHLWKTHHVSCEGNPNVDQNWVKRMLETYGSRDHVLYRIRVRGEFPLASHNSVYPLDLIEASSKYDLKSNHYDMIEMGVDVARYGGDLTAIAVKHGPEITHISRYPHLSTMETCGKVIRYINEYNPTVVRIDTIGVGGGVYDRLKELGYKQCFSFNSSNSPSEKRKTEFLNLRAEAHWNLREMLEQFRVKLPADENLASQMAAATYQFTSNGKIKISSKDEMKSLGQRSPDFLDAVLMACYPAMPQAKKTMFTNFSIFGR